MVSWIHCPVLVYVASIVYGVKTAAMCMHGITTGIEANNELCDGSLKTKAWFAISHLVCNKSQGVTRLVTQSVVAALKHGNLW